MITSKQVKIEYEQKYPSAKITVVDKGNEWLILRTFFREGDPYPIPGTANIYVDKNTGAERKSNAFMDFLKQDANSETYKKLFGEGKNK